MLIVACIAIAVVFAVGLCIAYRIGVAIGADRGMIEAETNANAGRAKDCRTWTNGKCLKCGPTHQHFSIPAEHKCLFFEPCERPRQLSGWVYAPPKDRAAA